jgi:hypothetical protein
MRGGFVICLGGDAAAVDRAAERMRWHRGTPVRTAFKGLHVTAFTDDAGPHFFERDAGLLVVHGESICDLNDLERHATRFAAVHWDGKTLHASRDPMGLAPLFYRRNGEEIWLASEMHPLLGLGPARVDTEALSARAAFVPLNERTGWEGIFRVLPGSTVELARSTSKTAFHWTPEKLAGTWRGSREQAKRELRRLLEQAVARCHRPGGGIVLSGGLDSASVCLAARGTSEAFLANVYLSSDQLMDERRYARAVAETMNVPLHELECRVEKWDVGKELERLGLIYNWIPIEIYERACAAFVANGCFSAMDGHDGDGVSGPPNGEWGALAVAGELRRMASAARAMGFRRAARGLATDFWPVSLRPWPSPKSYLQKTAAYFSGALRQRILDSDIENWRPPGVQWARRQLVPLMPQSMISHEQLEQETARMGVDLRHPFADRQLVEFMISLPCAIKAEPGRPKALLRDAFADIMPREILERIKSETSMPLLQQRADTAIAVIRDSKIELPGVDYDRLYRDAQTAPDSIPRYFITNLARYHDFARLAA